MVVAVFMLSTVFLEPVSSAFAEGMLSLVMRSRNAFKACVYRNIDRCLGDGVTSRSRTGVGSRARHLDVGELSGIMR